MARGNKVSDVSHGENLENERSRLTAECAAAPDDSRRCLELGQVCHRLARPGEALSHFADAATADPDWEVPRYYLGLILAEMGRPDEAMVAYRAALAVNPDHAESHFGLGRLFARRRATEEAVSHFDAAAAARADWHRPPLEKADLLAAAGDTAGARAAYDSALRAGAPDGVRLRRDLLLPVIADSAEDYAAARRRYETALDNLSADPPPLENPAREGGGARFYLAYHGADDRRLQEQLAALYRTGCPALDWTAPHCRESWRNPSVRRIGFVSRFFYDHSIGRLMQRLLAYLARRDDCEILLFDTAPVPDDPLRAELVSYADHVECLDAGLQPPREQIARHRPDILVYPDIGMDYVTYFLAFARLAPVQCVTWGHPVTTGVPTIDYFLSCDSAEPADAAAHYGERLVRLGGLPFSYARPDAPIQAKSRADFGLPEDATVYFLAQNLFKVHPDMDPALRQILERDPAGRLVLLEGHYPEWGQRLRARFARSLDGVADRVVFLPRQDHEDYMRLLALADVCLDSFPFGGGNTTYQALAMGTPVVTLPGDFLRGRLSLAIYCHLRVLECAAATADGYADVAVRLGTDPAWRDRVAKQIDTNLHRIFDDPDFLEEAERFLMSVVPGDPSSRR